MAQDAPSPAPSMTREELQAEAEMQMRDIGQRFGALPQDKDELLGLLEDAETWLVRLDQQKTRSRPEILNPTKGVLISRDLLDHPDPNVKLALTSCLTEVTRLTAPDAPYGDDVMKEVFQRIVDAFADLGDINSPSYERRVSILDSVARVRCCILMLDLDLDHLILDMFHHLFKAASANHSENVTQWMETILRAVIEESDDVHSELASFVLQNLTKEAQVTHPASFGLAERLVDFCKDRFKPVFCQETSKLDQDINCPGEDGIHPGFTPTTAISNGGAVADNNGSLDGLASSEHKPKLSSADDHGKIEQTISGDKEALEAVTTEKPFDVNSKKNQELDSSTVSGTNELSKIVNDNESLVASEKLYPETDRGDNKQLTEIGKKAADTTPAPIKKRGRPPAAKSQGKKPVKSKQGADLKSGKVDPISDSGGRVTLQQTKEDTKCSPMKAAKGGSKKNQHKFNIKLQKEDIISDEDTDEDTNLKETVSATRTDKTNGQQEDNRVSKRKCLLEAEEAPPSKKNKVLDKDLVGSRIRVWWPHDKMFYNGVIESFIASSKKHKVAYDDGDVEILLLQNERWELIDEEQDSDPDAASDMPCGGRGKGSLSQEMKEEKTGASESGSRGPPKKRGRPKGVRSSNNMSTADRHVSSAKLKGKGVEKVTQETPGGRIIRSTGKAKDDSVKANKDEAGSEDKSIEAVDGSKTNGPSTERKLKEKEDGSMEEEKAPAEVSTGKKRGRKSRN